VTIPNILTLSRFLLAPGICLLITLTSCWARSFAFLLFLVAAFTDFLDGYLAEKTNARSSVGAFLDPLADKVLITMVFFFMAGAHIIPKDLLWPCGLILARETLVLGLRGFVGAHSLPVVKSAKWKTHCQLMGGALLLYPPCGFFPQSLILLLARFSLWTAVILGVWSGYLYVQKTISMMQDTSDPF